MQDEEGGHFLLGGVGAGCATRTFGKAYHPIQHRFWANLWTYLFNFLLPMRDPSPSQIILVEGEIYIEESWGIVG